MRHLLSVWVSLCLIVNVNSHNDDVGVPTATLDQARELRAANPNRLIVDVVGEVISKELQTAVRDLDFFEIFSGSGGWSQAMKAKGYVGCSFDKATRHKTEDFATFPGFLHACRQVIRLRKGGHCWVGFPCSTFVYMSRSHTQRSLTNPLGCTRRRDVRDANKMARHMVYVFFLCACLGVHCILEQPLSSIFTAMPCVKDAMTAYCFKRMSTWLGAFGHGLAKPSYLVHNLPSFLADKFLKRKYNVRRIKDLSKAQAQARTQYYTLTKAKSKDRVWINGGSRLKASEHYPHEFCRAAIDLAVALDAQTSKSARVPLEGSAACVAQNDTCSEVEPAPQAKPVLKLKMFDDTGRPSKTASKLRLFDDTRRSKRARRML